MELKGDHYVYESSDGTARESNRAANRQVVHHRQPSYLAAIGITHPLQTAEPVRDYESFCSAGVKNRADNRHPDLVKRFGHNEDFNSRSASCREKTSSGPTSRIHGYANSQVGGGKGFGEFDKVSHTCNSSNARHPNKVDSNYKSNVQFGDMQDQDVNSVQFSNVKNIPQSVVVPMSRYATDFNPKSDRILSQPKTTKLVGNKEMSSSNYSELYSFASNAGKSQGANDSACHNMNQPGLAESQHRGGQGRRTRRTSYEDGAENGGYDYIHPRQVQHVLGLQQRSRKTCNRAEGGNASVVSRQPVVPAEACMTDSRAVADGRYCETVAGLPNVFLEVDRTSTSSGASRRRDFGYGSGHKTDGLTGSSGQSPDVPSCGHASTQLFHHILSGDLMEHGNIQGCKRTTDNYAILRSVSHQCDSNDLPKCTEIIESVKPSSNSSERNQKITAANTSSKICHKNQMVDVTKPKPLYDYRNRDVEYLQMPNKQVELCRARDEENMENCKISLPEAVLNPDVQTRRGAAFSSCIGIETPPLETAVNSDFSKCYGSADFNEYNLHCRARSDRMEYLKSQKKNLRLNQIGRGSHGRIHGDPGNSQLKDCLRTSDHSGSDKTVKLLDVQDAGSCISHGSGDNESPLPPCSKRNTVGQPCSFTEDIVSTWTITNDTNDVVGADADVQISDSQDFTKDGKHMKKNVSFSDSIALIAGVEETMHRKTDYVECATSFLQKRTEGLRSYEAKDGKNSRAETSSRDSLSSESRSNYSGSRSNSNVSIPESSCSSGSTRDRDDSDFYENDLSSECSENDSEGTTIDENGRRRSRCGLCHRRWVDSYEVYCRDCYFYMSKFQ